MAMRLLLSVLLTVLACPGPAGASRHPDAARVVAVTDVHGAYAELRSILRRAAIIDEQDRWRGGDAHLVSAGDMLDRGADSRRVLDLLMRLEQEASAAGGAVHVLLGNHELMNLTGDLDDVSPGEFAAFADEEDASERAVRRQEYLARFPADGQAAAAREFERRFPPGWFAHRRAFAADGRYGRWLLDRAAVVVVRDTLFVHGGLSAATLAYTLDDLNQAVRVGLRDYLAAVEDLSAAGWFGFDATPGERVRRVLERQRDARGEPRLREAAERLLAFHRSPLFDIEGPLWYRGLALCHPLGVADHLADSLTRHAVTRIAIGHTMAAGARITARHDGRVLLMDTGMLARVYRGVPSALVIDTTGPHALYLDGELPIPGDRRAVGYVTFPVDGAETERLLRESPASLDDRGASTRIGVALGGNDPWSRSAWLYLDRDAARGGSGAWRNELAAWRLDRLLGLYLVPTTVERSVEGRAGAVQWRDPDAVDAASAAADSPTTTPWCDVAAQHRALRVFDALIGLEVRDPDDLHYSSDEWLLLATDHRLAFTTRRNLPRAYRDRPTLPGPAFCRALAGLDRVQLEAALGGWLDGAQLTALLARRDRLVRQARAEGVACDLSPTAAGAAGSR